MDDLLKAFLTSLGSVGVFFAILWWWLQKYLDRRLGAHLNALETRLKGEAETVVDLRKKRLEKTAELLPKLQHSASECRNCLRNLKENLEDKTVLEFREKCEAYIDILYGSQLLLLPQTYEATHMFKSILDKVNILLNNTINEAKKQYLTTVMEKALIDLNKIYLVLQDSLRKDFQMLEQVPGNKQL